MLKNKFLIYIYSSEINKKLAKYFQTVKKSGYYKVRRVLYAVTRTHITSSTSVVYTMYRMHIQKQQICCDNWYR